MAPQPMPRPKAGSPPPSAAADGRSQKLDAPRPALRVPNRTSISIGAHVYNIEKATNTFLKKISTSS